MQTSCLEEIPYFFTSGKDTWGYITVKSWWAQLCCGNKQPQILSGLNRKLKFTHVKSSTGLGNCSGQLTSMCCQYLRLFWSSGSWVSSTEPHTGNSISSRGWRKGKRSNSSLPLTFHWPYQVQRTHLPSKVREMQSSKRRRLKIWWTILMSTIKNKENLFFAQSYI